MLKRLDLIGFKSFADKTHFDFGPGITAIVGPNGSGKSNIVDAVRWILGEQSAKSLRGDEMADVIFNGSATRKGLGLAEVTLTLDNTKRVLAIEADDVQITRRVYRDGQGEYLINKQPSRLRDIKEMFLGSGAGGSAYCVIEQGRVQTILDATTRERRIIFEEAAGISRFKARKIETIRKLEHVDQNLLRVLDILKELDEQLRKTRLQASKAKRYKEYLDRLKELRVAISLDEYHRLTVQLSQVNQQLEGLRTSLAARTDEDTEREARLQALEKAVTATETAAQQADSALADAKDRLANEDTSHRVAQEKAAALDKEIHKTRGEWQALNWELARVAGSADQAARELADAENECAGQREVLERLEQELAAAAARLRELDNQAERDKVDYFELFNQLVQRQNEERQKRSLMEQLRFQRQRLERKAEQSTQQLTQLDAVLRTLAESGEKTQEQLAATRAQLTKLRVQREQAGKAQEQIGEQVAQLREQRGRLSSRMEVLEGLEKSQEGLSAGVKEVLALATAPDAGPWRTVIGLVADLLTVSREHAPLLDIALGERAQYVLVRSGEALTSALAARPGTFLGRVTFWPAPSAPAWLSARAAGLPEHPGLIGPAAQLAACTQAEFGHLVEHLLGATLIVKDLAAAREISRSAKGFRFVTLQGDLLEADGVLTVGTHHAEAGLLSRKSELRELRKQAAELDQQIAATEQRLAQVRDELARCDAKLENAQQEAEILSQQVTELRSRTSEERQKQKSALEQMATDQSELQQFDRDLAALEEALPAAVLAVRTAEERVTALKRRQEEAAVETRALGQKREQAERTRGEVKAALAKALEQRKNAAVRAQEAQSSHQQKQADQRDKQEQLASVQEQLRQCEQSMLRASDAMARAYVDKEHAEQQSRSHREDAERLKRERQDFMEKSQSARHAWQQLQQQIHDRDLEANDLGHLRDGLAARLKEEHDLDLAELYRQRELVVSSQLSVVSCEKPGDATTDNAQRSTDQAQDEIAELKRKIQRLGNVNPDALTELQELETRATGLQTQHDDLAAAKHSLEEIIEKINQDSRALFSSTFDAIRGHFQELFRKMFGGGMADIVLEDPQDVLECGVDIVARPPGKELTSISLLSGGEKTLTALVLLLAIFRSRPSPFCLLDEVDAALDESNIGRFAAALRDYTDMSQFIVITHAKKTMAAADVLYGVTMQESGVSKRIVVRMEDYPEAQAAKKAG